MKLVRFGPPGRERPGLWLDSAPGVQGPALLDVNAMAFDIADYDSHFFAHGGLSRLSALMKDPRPRHVPAAGMRLGPPVARPANILCLGKNYAEHAREFGGPVPDQPVVFAKASTSLCGAYDEIELPPGAGRVDGEAELAIVIGRRAHALDLASAMGVIAGYPVLNDVTDRDLQKSGLHGFLAKSADTFCPLGPWLVTPDEVPDPHRLRVFSTLNGEPVQDGSTADMVFRIPEILVYISRIITLEPGDIVSTGTPAGIGSIHNPARLLLPGRVLETGVEGLGVQRAVIQQRT